jgi:peptidyl-prolyl cis-trans isomerase C
VGACACEESKQTSGGAGEASQVLARFSGGVITAEELTREAQRLPPELREQFETAAGRREFLQAMVDKRLLLQEARRRGLHEAPEVRRQVQELEDRLAMQALLAEEERATGPASEAEVRAFYEARKAEFAEPERVRVGRLLAALKPGAGAGERAKARQRAEAWAAKLRRGEPLEKVATEGDGPERTQRGELGLFARGEFPAKELEEAAFSLRKAGEVSAVLSAPEGASVLVLLERRPGRIPSLEEVRPLVEGRMAPGFKRKGFDELLRRLRGASSVELDVVSRQ